MSSFDQTIARDLDALSAENRSGIPALGATLRALAPSRSNAPAGIDISLLATAQVYTRRFASVATGTAATTCVLALLAWLSNPFGLHAGPRIETVVDHIVYAGPVDAALWFALVVLATYAAALRLGDRRVARVLTQSPSGALAQLRARAAAMAGLVAGLRVAGAASFIIALGMSWFSIGTERCSVFWESGRDFRVVELMHHAMVVAVLGALVAAAGVAFAVQHRRLTRVVRTLAHPAVTASGVALGVATVVAGLRLDVGPWFETFASAAVPSKALRVVLTVTGSLAVVLVVASAALRRNQRERVCAEQP